MDEEQSQVQGAGGRAVKVERTGFAFLRQGEWVVPEAESEAQASQVAEDAQSVIHYYFPVEIEVRAAPEAMDMNKIVEATLSHLAQSLESV